MESRVSFWRDCQRKVARRYGRSRRGPTFSLRVPGSPPHMHRIAFPHEARALKRDTGTEERTQPMLDVAIVPVSEKGSLGSRRARVRTWYSTGPSASESESASESPVRAPAYLELFSACSIYRLLDVTIPTRQQDLPHISQHGGGLTASERMLAASASSTGSRGLKQSALDLFPGCCCTRHPTISPRSGHGGTAGKDDWALD